MAKHCTRKRRVFSPAAGKTVSRCAKFSGGAAKSKSRKSSKSRK